LTPFRYDDDAFWTAYSARSTRSFGYTFPEIDDWNGSPEDLARRVRGRVNALYNPRRRPTTRKHRRHINAGGSRTKHGTQERGLDLGELGSSIIDGLTDLVEDLGDLARTSLENFAELGINNLGKQWVINVKVDKYVIS
jgi:tyrosinase